MTHSFQHKRPIWRMILIILVAFSTGLLAFFQQNTLLWIVFYAQLPFMLYAVMIFGYPLSTFIVERSIHRNALPDGAPIQVKVRLRRNNRFPIAFLVVTDHWHLKGTETMKYEASKLFVFSMKKEYAWTYSIDTLPRGEYVSADVSITITDPLHWIEHTRNYANRQSFLVFPKMYPVRRLDMTESAALDESAVTRKSFDNQSAIASIRPYEHGDRMAWIHWKSFAKTSTLMTKEFEEPIRTHTTLVFDNREGDAFEERVMYIASRLKEAQVKQQPHDFMTLVGQEKAQSIHSTQAFQDVLIELARIQPSRERVRTFEERIFIQEKLDAVVFVSSWVDWDLIDKFVQQAPYQTQLYYLVVLPKGQHMTERLTQDIMTGHQRSMTIRVITFEEISQMFVEVTR